MAKYLIIGPSWVGDMVMANSLFKQIKQNDPTAIIDVVGPAWSAAILGRMPEIRNAITLNINHGEWGIATRRKLGHSLRNEQYDKSIVLPRSWKAALVPFFAKAKQRIGFHGEQRYILLNERRKLDKKILNQTVKRFTSLGLEKEKAYPPSPKNIPTPKLVANDENLAKLFTQFNLAKDKPAACLMPGAEYGPSKQWPLKHFREVTQDLLNKGFQVWVLGGPKDKNDGDVIVNKLGENAINLCGQTKLIDTVDLLSHADFAISNDSGLMHVAAAVGTHVHAIYGSTSEDFTPPLTEKKTIHNLHLDCSPCFKRVCPLGHTDCQNKLTSKKVLGQLEIFFK